MGGRGREKESKGEWVDVTEVNAKGLDNPLTETRCQKLSMKTVISSHTI